MVSKTCLQMVLGLSTHSGSSSSFIVNPARNDARLHPLVGLLLTLVKRVLNFGGRASRCGPRPGPDIRPCRPVTGVREDWKSMGGVKKHGRGGGGGVVNNM